MAKVELRAAIIEGFEEQTERSLSLDAPVNPRRFAETLNSGLLLFAYVA
jgi:hypothetical protein